MTNSKAILESVGREIKDNPPRVLGSTARKYGKQRANKQRIAILLNKSRARGAKIGRKR